MDFYFEKIQDSIHHMTNIHPMEKLTFPDIGNFINSKRYINMVPYKVFIFCVDQNFQVGLHQRKLTDQHDISDQLLSNSGDSLQMLDSEFVWVMDFYFVK